MNVLIGFERSGIVRNAFAAKGHNAWSCDLMPSHTSGNHFQCDIYKALYRQNWDLIILHPMCTALCLAGNKHYGKGQTKHHLRLDAIEYTEKLWHDALSVCSRVCLENPTSVLTTQTDLPKPQYIQPYMFGHLEQKKTALFLHGLPDLITTDNVYDQMMELPINQRQRIFHIPPGPQRAEIRSQTFAGIAKAMADQWNLK